MGDTKRTYSHEIGELDHYLFGQGNHYEIYKKMGAHMVKQGETEGVYFAVWAPHAVSAVSYTHLCLASFLTDERFMRFSTVFLTIL